MPLISQVCPEAEQQIMYMSWSPRRLSPKLSLAAAPTGASAVAEIMAAPLPSCVLKPWGRGPRTMGDRKAAVKDLDRVRSAGPAPPSPPDHTTSALSMLRLGCAGRLQGGPVLVHR